MAFFSPNFVVKTSNPALESIVVRGTVGKDQGSEMPSTITSQNYIKRGKQTSPPSWSSVVLKQLWFGLAYFVMATLLSFFNKRVFAAGFDFPIALCFTQMFGVVLFLIFWREIRRFFREKSSNIVYAKDSEDGDPFSLNNFGKKVRTLLAIALCLAINVILSNWSLYYLDINVFIIIRSSSVIWIIIFSRLILSLKITFPQFLSCILVFLGGATVGWTFTVHAETEKDTTASHKFFGLVLCMTSTIANGLNMILMKKVLSQIQADKDSGVTSRSHGRFLPMDFLFYQSLDAGVVMFFGVMFSEASPLSETMMGRTSEDLMSAGNVLLVLLMSCIMTVFYQLSLIGLVANTTPLGKEIISQTKVIPQTLLAVFMFDEYFSFASSIGLLFAVAGVFLYSGVSFMERKKPRLKAKTVDT